MLDCRLSRSRGEAAKFSPPPAGGLDDPRTSYSNLGKVKKLPVSSYFNLTHGGDATSLNETRVTSAREYFSKKKYLLAKKFWRWTESICQVTVCYYPQCKKCPF